MEAQNCLPPLLPVERSPKSMYISDKTNQDLQQCDLNNESYKDVPTENSNDDSDKDFQVEIETHSLKLFDEPEVKFSEDERKVMDTMVVQYEKCYCSVNFGEGLIKEMIMCSMFGTPVSTSAAIQGYRMIIERVTKIADNLPAFTDLTREDRDSLLKENADLVVSLRGAIFFDPDKLGIEQVLLSVGKGELVLNEFLFL